MKLKFLKTSAVMLRSTRRVRLLLFSPYTHKTLFSDTTSEVGNRPVPNALDILAEIPEAT